MNLFSFFVPKNHQTTDCKTTAGVTAATVRAEATAVEMVAAAAGVAAAAAIDS
jgi:hypothetical protein